MAETTVYDVMRHDVPSVMPDDTVATVAKLMVASGLPGVPVVSDAKIVGIVTESDLIERQANIDVPQSNAFFDLILSVDAGRDFDEEIRRVLGATAGDVMTHPVYSIKSSATLDQLATLMVNEHVNPVPVVDDQHRLIGIVSRADLVKVIARWESEDSTNIAQGSAT